MKSRSLWLLVAVLVLLVAVPGVAAATQEEEEPSPAATEETEFDSGGAAVAVRPEEAEEADEPWTSRFMYPLLVVGTLVLIVFLILYYFLRIKGRYEVVEG